MSHAGQTGTCNTKYCFGQTQLIFNTYNSRSRGEFDMGCGALDLCEELFWVTMGHFGSVISANHWQGGKVISVGL